MRCLLLLPLLLLLRGRAERPPETGPAFRLLQQREETEPSNATTSPCEGLRAAGLGALTLTNRSLERLPGCLPRGLHSLDAGHNLLRALSASDLGHLPQLRVLSLRHNRIEALSWGAGEPAGLHTLDLGSNRLVALPPCEGSGTRSGLRALSLAGNPVQTLPPGAFSCFPALRQLNLSCTALGRGLGDAAFTAAGGAPLAALEVLDLSGTFLEQIRMEWTHDLPNLTSLYLRKMPRLRILQGDIFQMTPHLQLLDCQDSPALSFVHTHIFEATPHLQLLQFQNCNLSSFPPWTLHSSSQVLSIHLFGNPLTCSCELSWLLMDAKTVVSRAADTVCTPAAAAMDPAGPFSAPLALSQLPGVCHSEQSTTLRDANLPSADSSTHTPAPQILSTPPGPTKQNVTEVPSLLAHTNAGKVTIGALTPWTAGPSTPHLPRGTAGTQRRELATQLDLGANLSAATRPAASKWPKPGSNRRTRRPPQAPAQTPSAATFRVSLLDDDTSEVQERVRKKGGSPPQPCDYHPCRHLQTPCALLQRRSRCLCPGLSSEDELPDAPRLQAVAEISDTSALLRWCAPTSVVHKYEIRFHRDDESENQSSVVSDLYATARQHPLYGLAPGTTYRVCVLAANKAGLSQLRAADSRACGAFTTKPSFVLIFAGLCAAAGLLLISTVLLSICLCRRACASRPPRCDTHLVAYKNPAFDYPLKLQTLN